MAAFGEWKVAAAIRAEDILPCIGGSRLCAADVKGTLGATNVMTWCPRRRNALPSKQMRPRWKRKASSWECMMAARTKEVPRPNEWERPPGPPRRKVRGNVAD